MMTNTCHSKSSSFILAICLLFAQSCSALKPFVAATTTVPPLIDVPTYSMATLNEDGTTNMNILTYATPVSVRPDRVWSLGLYKETLSFQNFQRTRSCVLQLLTEKHIPLVKLLGGTSGREVNKQEECEKLGAGWGGLPTGDKEDPLVLPDCTYYLKLSAVGELVDCGSHSVAICRVDEMLVSNDESRTDYVSTARLRDLGIITEQGRAAE